MAITIVQDIQDQNGGLTWIAAYAQNIIIWKDDTAPNDTLYGEVEVDVVGGGDATIITKLVPNSDNEIVYDLSEVLMSYLQKIQDPNNYDDILNREDLNLYVNLEVTLRTYSSTQMQSESAYPISLYVTRGVMQINPDYADYAANPYTQYYQMAEGRYVALALLPDRTLPDENQRIVIWKGYPQDVALLCDVTIATGGNHKSVEVNGMTSGISGTYAKKLFHLYLQNGDGTLPAYITGGILEITIEDRPAVCTIDYEIRDECGVYMKWLNHKGGYSYWLFSPAYTIGESTSAVDEMPMEVTTQAAIGNQMPTAYQGAKTQTIRATGLSEWQLEHVQEMAKSLYVVQYLGEHNTSFTTYDKMWQRMHIASSSVTLVDTKKKIYNVAFNLVLPQLNYPRQ